jgi:WD40 repeat protein
MMALADKTDSKDGILASSSTVGGETSADTGGIRFGDYLLEQEIAHGGMGVVYRARQLSLRRTVAVKLLLLGRYSSADSIERFRREAESAAALRHPNIVAIYEIGEHDGQQFFSMDYVDGSSLAQMLRLGPFEPRRSAEVARDIAQAIHYAHGQGVLHRDLKPSNVLLDPFGQVRITDFGLAKRLDGSSDLTTTGQVVGTPNYLSPEHAAGKHAELGPASDVYSIGALLYELLTGRPPFLSNSLQETLVRIQNNQPVSPHALNPALHRDLETICLKCLRKEPARRYPTALALAEDLQRWLQHQPIEARPVALAERAWLWARRKPYQALTIAAALATVAAVFITLVVANLRVSTAHHETQVKAAESLHRLAQLNVETGNHLVSDGDWGSALLWFVEALRLEQGDPRLEEIHRRRIGSVMRMGPQISQLFVQEGLLNSAVLNADGTRLVTTSLDGNIRLWDVATGQPLLHPMPHPGGVAGAWFTRDGRHILSLASDKSLRVWDAETGEPVGTSRQLTTSKPKFTDLSDDGRWFAAPTEKGAEIFEAGTMTPREPPLPSLGRADSVRFSPGGHLLAVAESTGIVRVWDMTSDPPTYRVIQLPKRGYFLSFDPAGEKLAILFDGVNLQLWDVETGLTQGEPMVHPENVYSVEFRPDGRWLATACWDGLVRLWDVQSCKLARAPLPQGTGARTAEFTQDGSRLITVTWGSVIRVWDPDSGQTVCPIIRQVGFEATASPTPDGAKMLVSSHDPAVRLWDLPAIRPARLTLRQSQLVGQAHFSPDGKSVLTSSDDGTAKLWDSATGTLLRSMPHQGQLRQSCFSPDGRTIATGSSDGSTRIWDAETGWKRGQTSGQTGRVRSLSFSPDSSRFATAAEDGTARVWSATNGQPLTPTLSHRGAVGVMFFGSDGARVLTASTDGTAQLWDATTGSPLGPVMKHPGPVTTAAISPDGRRLLTGCGDNTTLPYSAQMWDAKTCRPVGRPMPHMDGVIKAVFSADGSRIVSAGEDNCAQIWDGITGERLTPPLQHSAYVYGAFFSPNGRLLLTVSEDSTARVWDSATGEPVTPPLRQMAPVVFGDWSPDSREVVTCANDGTACVWDISPIQAPLSELQLRAEVLSTHYLKPNIGALPLTAQEIESRWLMLQTASRNSP